jgi:hypothetical protein
VDIARRIDQTKTPKFPVLPKYLYQKLDKRKSCLIHYFAGTHNPMGRFRGAISIYCFMAEHNGDKSVLKTYG